MCDDKRKALEEVFKLFDSDGSGKIDQSEIKNALREYYKQIGETVDDSKLDEEAGEIIKACDSSKDGKIELSEWLKFFEV